MRKVISNTSCLIALSNSKRLDILKTMYGQIIITPEVADEFGDPLPDWIKIVPVADRTTILSILNVLDLGEASTIALSLENNDSIMILDDGKARRFAKNMNLVFTGTLGVIAKASQLDKTINLENVLLDLRISGFRIPQNIESLLLKKV